MLLEAGLAAAGQIGLGAINSIFTRDAEKRQQNYNQRVYERNRNDALSDWNMQNEYNSPEAQMRRFKEAGLNPNLIYGSGTSSPSSPIKQSESGSFQATPMKIDQGAIGDSINTYYNVQKQQAEIDNMKTANEVMEKNKLLMDQRISSTMWDSYLKSIGYTQKTLDYDIKKAQSPALKWMPQTHLDNLVKEGKIKDADLQTKNMYNKFQSQLLQSQLTTQLWNQRKNQQDITESKSLLPGKMDKLHAEVYNTKMSSLLKEYQSATESAKREKVFAEINNLLEKRKILEKDNQYYETKGVSNFLKGFINIKK